MNTLKKKDTHPLAINIQKLQRYNYDYFNCEEVVLFEYLVIKGMAFKSRVDFYHSSETIRKETGIKKHSLRSIISRFESLGIISTEIKGMPRVKHFQVHFPKIVELFPKIYHSSENGQLSAEFSKHLFDFFHPLVENYQKKNNIKNNNKENNKKETSVYVEEDVESFKNFNDFLSKLKYENNLTERVLTYSAIDLHKVLQAYDFDILKKFIEKYFREESLPSLKKFFKFDKLNTNKLTFIEEQLIEDNRYVEAYIETLQKTYNSRIKMYNKRDDTERKKSESKLVVTKKIQEKIKIALEELTEVEINHAFISYIDTLLNGDSGVRKILPYFFSYSYGEYNVINEHLDYFNLNYSHT
ncbi:hypothetical protein [Croceibacter atlanticus]|jgi:hypothetical protein|uniref:hypothetical protein n=1 Tax=Croceibacter atlanticus TaxID=313588 RepID=UPI0030DB36EB|tara:strand:- start:170466 stop:171533 length:1068 start_codon:yes stop_codon:yes gene_type:complete